MLLKEFLEDNVDNITEQDFINLKSQINDLDKLKKAANEKIKADVNYSDIKALTNALTTTGIPYKSYEDFYEYMQDYFDSSPYAKKLLDNNFAAKYPDRNSRDILRKEINNLRTENSNILNSGLAELTAKKEEVEDKISLKKDELADYKTNNGWDSILKRIVRQMIKENQNILSNLGSLWVLYFIDEDAADFSMDKDTFKTLERDIHFGRDINYYLNTFADRYAEAYVNPDLSEEEYKECQKNLRLMWKYLLNEKANLDYSIPFDRWKHYQIKAAFSTIKFLQTTFENYFRNEDLKKLQNQEEYNEHINGIEDEISKLNTELDNIGDERYSTRETIQNSNADYIDNAKKIHDLESLLYYHIDKEYIENYIKKKYIRYLIHDCLDVYIKKLMDKLQIVQGRFGIGKGTGSALTRFRHYEENVNNILSDSEKAMLIGWLCKHIRRMMVHVMEGGASEKVFNLLFPNVHNYDTSLKSSDNAWDARSGEIIIDSEENITPQIQKLFNKVTSNKTQTGISNAEQESGRFTGNRLNSAPFVYLLLDQYYNFGFTLGNITITPEQAYELQRNKFPQEEKAFERGYNS